MLERRLQALRSLARDSLNRDSCDLSLARGAAGWALALVYGSEDEGDHALAQALLSASASALPRSAGLFSGLSGVLWTMQHLGDVCTGGDDPRHCFAEPDPQLVDWLRGDPGELDLCEGVAGVALYALAHEDCAWSSSCLDAAVAHFEAKRERGDQGWFWRAADGEIDLGLAHGVPGIIVALARIAEERENHEAAELAAGALQWLQTQARRPFDTSIFPSFSGWTDPSRVAWCYGDLGVAWCLAYAGRVVGNSSCRELAAEAALAAARRDLSSARIDGTSLCHGSAGGAHLFRRLHDELDVGGCEDAAYRYVEHLLEFETAPALAEDQTLSGILEGHPGAIFVLASLLDEDCVGWDRWLGL